MRKSLSDIQHMVRKIPYLGELPPELKNFHYYISDNGHCIMCILKIHLKDAEQSGMDNYEVPIPVKYVLENGYQIKDDYVIVDAEYDPTFGLMVDDKYSEF